MNTNKEIPFGKDFPSAIDEKLTFKVFLRSMSSLMGSKESAVKDARLTLVDLPLNPVEAKKILPLGMRLADPPMARLFIVSYGKAVYSPTYNEAALNILVRTPLGTGGHVSWMVVDNDSALIYGRELLACPKKLADIAYKEEGEEVSASVTRQGTTVFSIDTKRIEKEENPDFVLAAKAFNVGGIGQCLIFNPVWIFKLKEIIYDSYSAEGTLILNDSPYDPLKKIVAEYSNPIKMRVVNLDLIGTPFLLPVGFAGMKWFLNTFNLRFR